MRTAALTALLVLSAAFVAAGDARPPSAGLIVFASTRGPNVDNTELYSVGRNGKGRVDLSRNQGSDSNASPSPGGQRLAFVSHRIENGVAVSGLYVMRFDGSRVRRVTPPDLVVHEDGRLSWSPDGSRIAFAGERGAESGVFVVDLGGGSAHLVAPDSRLPTWAPSGERIAFMKAEFHGSSFVSRIGVVAPDGDGLALLTDDHHDTWPTWSPDGLSVAFTRQEEPWSQSLYTLQLPASAPRLVVTRETGGIEGVSWPVPARIIFTSGVEGIWSVSPLGADLENLAAGESPSPSADGEEIVFVRGSVIYRMSIDGRNVRLVLRSPGLFRGDDGGPVWLSGRSRIVFASISRARDYDLWLADANGGGLRRVANTAANERLPQWSPDHSRLAYARTDRRGKHPTISVMTVGTRRVRTVARGTSPSWSPDGSRLAFASDRSIFWKRLSGRKVHRLIAGQNPAWSPTRAEIAFIRDAQLLVMDLNRRKVKVLVDFDVLLDCEEVHAGVATPEWSPNGKRLAVVAQCDTGRVDRVEAWVLRRDGTGLRTLDLQYPGISRVAWSPRGDRLAYVAGVGCCTEGYGLFSLGLDGSNKRLVTWSASHATDPDW
jgi:TolB protein